jgi:hypothetical protein
MIRLFQDLLFSRFTTAKFTNVIWLLLYLLLINAAHKKDAKVG